jgi:hypothetical protein
VAQGVEHLPSKHEALSSNPVPSNELVWVWVGRKEKKKEI